MNNKPNDQLSEELKDYDHISKGINLTINNIYIDQCFDFSLKGKDYEAIPKIWGTAILKDNNISVIGLKHKIQPKKEFDISIEKMTDQWKNSFFQTARPIHQNFKVEINESGALLWFIKGDWEFDSNDTFGSSLAIPPEIYSAIQEAILNKFLGSLNIRLKMTDLYIEKSSSHHQFVPINLYLKLENENVCAAYGYVEKINLTLKATELLKDNVKDEKKVVISKNQLAPKETNPNLKFRDTLLTILNRINTTISNSAFAIVIVLILFLIFKH